MSQMQLINYPCEHAYIEVHKSCPDTETVYTSTELTFSVSFAYLKAEREDTFNWCLIV